MVAHGAERRIALVRTGGMSAIAVEIDPGGAELSRTSLSARELPSWVAEQERTTAPRWIFRTTTDLYPALLGADVRVARAHDLVLCHAILRDTARLADPLTPEVAWQREEPTAEVHALFDAWDEEPDDPVATLLAQYRAQSAALGAAEDSRLAMLCAAESAGGLVAAEMQIAGLPWDRATHERILIETLGARSSSGGAPARMGELGDRVRDLLDDRTLHLDSHPKLLRALHRVGVLAESTSRWELAQHDHPVIAPLLEYKKLARLLSANGWAWLDEWVHDRRFRPVYIPGGVVTGRWASAGGGALQVPRQLRPAVRADDGWTLVVADVAQLEPRMLAAMAADAQMAQAARGTDLYAGVVDSGAVATREEAKYAVLGAMYGATSGDSGRLLPRLRKVYPRAMKLVDDAAQRGEDGGVVSTWLGRSSPVPSDAWKRMQAMATAADGSPVELQRARQAARERGRFTRNFVVQGTAAEWSLIWLAEIRHRLWNLPRSSEPAAPSGAFRDSAHLAFFLHDEVIIHSPAALADQVADAVREAADVATRRLFGSFPIDVPLDLRIAESADK
ncbi:MAG: bifunctional 3'-5' exonuclease/DNA polymerase [Actinomycetota bacterium]